VTLEFKVAQDAEKWTKSFLVRPVASPLSLEDFIMRLETDDYVPALLYNELQPRNVTWLSEIEKDWLRRVSEIVTVPFVDSTTNDIQMDGRLDESVWQTALTKDTQHMGQLASRGPKKATLCLRYSNEALYVGVRGDGLPSDCSIEVGILKLFDIHTADSPRWMARIHGNTVASAIYIKQQQPVPWTCDWKGATTSSGTVWQAEVRIPFAGLAPMAVPKVEQRWRLTCDLHAGGSDIDSTPIAYWGHSDHVDIERGVLIVFGSQQLGR
jgi:hypothetical protein